MATRNIIDLSQPITPASPAPCDPPVEFRTVASHGPDSPYQMMWFGMTDHTGTHIDAPLHFVPGGKPIDEADLSALYSMPGVFVPMIGKMRKTTQSRYIRTRAMI